MANKNEARWNFDNSYTHLPKSFFSSMNTNPVKSPKLVILNACLAKSLGLDSKELQSDNGVAELSGNDIPAYASPLAQAYAGHQFGHFTMLGDGRALLLGEQITPQGERFDIQLKGSGRTPYSRGGDGRAALGPMLREYIISEAMNSLGIPTTRSLAVVTTGEAIIREEYLPGAILTRVAASHLRVGTFEYAARLTTVEDLQALADYAIQRHYPHLVDHKERYLALLQEVIKKQASLISKWQLVGFIHGVMNTDNMTVSGETIDYGPCAFMNQYDPATVFSSIDRQGRYAYGNQPYIGAWNLARFAETLLPLLNESHEEAVKIAENAISEYGKIYETNYLKGMKAKLGLFNDEDQDEALVKELLAIMLKNKADYTNTFIHLTFNTIEKSVLYNKPDFTKWHEKWQARLERQQQSMESIHELMRNSNPAIIPRNHRVEEALDAAVEDEDYSVMEQLLDVLSNPYGHTPEQAEYASLPPDSDEPFRTFCGT
ncbi:protein adenylyltransferase SelO [Ferdinandcohnia quinoae]|uniref:Protein nucleotidyltransferase YdiU n=1 Tax=Fredinandcohnia quinoae TaxID=2918902 RepID=A0AAW5EC21_9BACI|nr:YdiU family protein [Fredinandcohnia sp. SECRCQ15]MCH1626718.1 YdiU family protein [Fredinandcohnia sp. SECRCQ15]